MTLIGFCRMICMCSSLFLLGNRTCYSGVGDNAHVLSFTTFPSSMSVAGKLLVDIHTHVYLPRYASLLRTRTSVPLIRTNKNAEGVSEDRLLILDHEPSGGRPVGPQYWDREGISIYYHYKHYSYLFFYHCRKVELHG